MKTCLLRRWGEVDCSLESLRICSKDISVGSLRKRDCFQFQVKDARILDARLCLCIYRSANYSRVG